MQFEYDPERLIEEVKKRPGIWDYEHPDYRAKNVRYQLWNDVVTELMQTSAKLSKSEMRELEIQLQKKWKSIRDCFQKYLMRPSRTRRPYIYTKHLQFLLKDQESNRKNETEEGSSGSEENTRPRKSWRPKKKLKLVKDEEQSSDEDNEDVDNTEVAMEEFNDDIEIAAPQMKNRLNKLQTDEFMFANVDAQTKSDADDPDKLFLISLLPHLKTIPEEFRLNVKMDLMQVLRNANYDATRDHKLI